MAALALGYVGSVIGAEIGGTVLGVAASTIGGFIGSSLGSMLDNMAMKVTGGPKIGDLSVQVSTYGNPIPLLFGPENRIAGNVIWIANNKLIEHKHKKSKGILGAVLTGGVSLLKDSKTPAGYTYTASFAVAFADARIKPTSRIVKVWANKKLVWDNAPNGLNKSAKVWQSMAFYTGAFTQSPDPVIESYLGVGNTPAYRGTSYIRIEEMQLADYGNAIPTIEVLLEADTQISVRGTLARICALAGIDPNTAGTSSVEGDVRGFAVGAQSSAIAAIQPLALVYDFDAAEVAGAARFLARGLKPAAVIPTDDLGVRAPADEVQVPLQWSRAPETDLPKEASVTYLDPARDYQTNSQTSSRFQGSADSNITSQVAVVVGDPDHAKKIADRMLWEAWNARTSLTAQSSDRWAQIEAGRVYLFETPAGLEPLRVKKRTRGANGVLELQCVRDRSDVYKSTQGGAAAPIPPQVVSEPAPSIIALMDMPMINDADDDTGFYLSVSETKPGWRGASIVRSENNGGDFDAIAVTGYQNIIGTITSLADGVTAIFDQANTLRVTLFDPDGELSTVSEDDLLNNLLNAAWVGPASGAGGEVLQFKTATMVSNDPRVYDLTNLLRGRLGTEYATGTHGAGELFVLLGPVIVSRLNFGVVDWNKSRQYSAVTLLTDIVDATPRTFTNTGEGKRPLSPAHVRSVKADNGDVSVTWARRSRFRQAGIGKGDPPLGEATESYEIDVLSGSTVKRTLTATTPTVTYTASQITTDGFSGGSSVTFRVYQISAIRGRGRPGTGKIVL